MSVRSKLSASGDVKPATIRDRIAADDAKRRARQKADEDARLRRAEAAEAVWQLRQEQARRVRADREIRDLMRPGYGH
ncbi:hypothetical protein [Sanguibacter massiliensis]|uniref:hypothetical protein n=1 Tax=Sanguibacter massiliensis TaxID=1973217 RepID=UPI000C85143E|nr:hypothetical protein [Sanguibacter massiliensis]